LGRRTGWHRTERKNKGQSIHSRKLGDILNIWRKNNKLRKGQRLYNFRDFFITSNCRDKIKIMEVSPEILEKAKKVEELIAEWENALESKDMEKLKKIAYEILKMGDEFMKKIWKDIKPGEKISDVAKKVIEQGNI
jgi:hypothetical protein